VTRNPEQAGNRSGADFCRSALPVHRGLYYDGGWNEAKSKRRPADPALANGFFLEPTVFVDVTPEMRVAREEIFGPVLAVLRWDDEVAMVRAVNALDYGLTCSIWTNDLAAAHRTVSAVEAGYIWVNEVGRHFPGTPFGGYKQSGIGREECLEELISYTQEKNIYIRFPRPNTGWP
jgi:betaine-aldehyde dehydrogenase